MPIRVLPSELVNQIAAGEVVERPASVVKELVENALDSGALAIDVILEQGGRRLIEVRDDGCGMSASDARLALERHATSKITSFDDLVAVATLGFRGEALPSIASVSRFRIVTSDGQSSEGTEVLLDAGGEIESRPAARDRGTTVTVRELFENVPARRKFLKSADAEFRAIVAIVTSYALPFEDRAFRLEHNGRVVIDLPRAGSRRERALQVLGSALEDELVAIESQTGSVGVTGWVTQRTRWGSRRNQFFFVNGRLVKDRVLTHAAGRAASAFDFDGHPGMVLFVTIPNREVDVNVHPAKTEVRFRDSGPVHVAVEGGVRRALGGAAEGSALLATAIHESSGTMTIANGVSEIRNGTHTHGQIPFDAEPQVREDRSAAWGWSPLFNDRPVVQPPREAVAAAEANVDPGLGALRGRVIGQYRLSYIVIETAEGLRLVDQHVAHERVLYDRFAERVLAGSPESQRLLTPEVHTFGAAEAGAIESHMGALRSAGFEIERFSGNSFVIASIPPELGREGSGTFLRKLLDASADGKESHVDKVRERILASLACQAAIKVHRPLGGDEMARLVAELLGSSNPYACPHGRPVIVDIRHADVERHFHRR